MTPEAQRIAIAQACGWKETHIMQMGAKGKYVRTYQKGRGKLHQHLPDCLNDLNAMHEAEVWLYGADYYRYTEYIDNLHDVCAKSYKMLAYRESATAAQRAEAFLKTLNLWKP